MRREAGRHLALLARPERILRGLLGCPARLLLSWGDWLTKSEFLNWPCGEHLEVGLRCRPGVSLGPLLRTRTQTRKARRLPRLCLIRPSFLATSRHGFCGHNVGTSGCNRLEASDVNRQYDKIYRTHATSTPLGAGETESKRRQDFNSELIIL